MWNRYGYRGPGDSSLRGVPLRFGMTVKKVVPLERSSIRTKNKTMLYLDRNKPQLHPKWEERASDSTFALF